MEQLEAALIEDRKVVTNLLSFTMKHVPGSK